MPMDSQTFKIINDLLENKLELLNQIYDLTKLQCDKVEEDSIDKLLNLIDSKEIRIDRIKNVDIRFSSILHKNNANKLRELSFTEDLFLQLEDKENRIKELSRKIYEVELGNEKTLRKKSELIKEKLKTFKKGKKVTSSYYKIPTQAQGYFIDNKK